MAADDTAAFLREWQTGVLLLLGSVFGGVALLTSLGAPNSGFVGLARLLVGSVLTFLVLSYLLYGR